MKMIFRRNSRIFAADLDYPEDVERTTMDMNEFISRLAELDIKYKLTARLTEKRLIYEVIL